MDFITDAVTGIGNLLSQRINQDNFVVQYIKSSYKNDPYRVVIELLLFFFAMKYVLKPKTVTKDNELSAKEIDQLVTEWQPEPLVAAELPKCVHCHPSQQDNLVNDLLISGKHGIVVTIKGRQVLNCSSHDILGFSQEDALVANAKKVLRRYGVGTCGPRGFYGTLDIHLEFEEKFAKFLGVEASILYSQAFSTVVSTIPAFAKRGDIIVADAGSNIAIQKGIELSRSNVFYFRHNDMQNLQHVLLEVERRYPKSSCRKFIITEGLFQVDCSICPLEPLMQLKKKFKYRLIVDETWSIGCLGSTGRGVTEFFGVDASEVDIIVGSLAHSFGAGGGFCAGSTHIVDHQRLSSQAYCFSASLPAILTSTAICTMEMMRQEEEHGMFSKLGQLLEAFNEKLSTGGKNFKIIGAASSPIRYLAPLDGKESTVLRLIANAMEKGILLSQTHGMHDENDNLLVWIKLTLSIGYSKEQFAHLVNFLNKNL